MTLTLASSIAVTQRCRSVFDEHFRWYVFVLPLETMKQQVSCAWMSMLRMLMEPRDAPRATSAWLLQSTEEISTAVLKFNCTQCECNISLTGQQAKKSVLKISQMSLSCLLLSPHAHHWTIIRCALLTWSNNKSPWQVGCLVATHQRLCITSACMACYHCSLGSIKQDEKVNIYISISINQSIIV